MTVEKCVKSIGNLEQLLNTYDIIYHNPESCFFKGEELRAIINITKKELKRLGELLDNYELDNSYDQNTGEYHVFYRG